MVVIWPPWLRVLVCDPLDGRPEPAEVRLNCTFRGTVVDELLPEELGVLTGVTAVTEEEDADADAEFTRPAAHFGHGLREGGEKAVRIAPGRRRRFLQRLDQAGRADKDGADRIDANAPLAKFLGQRLRDAVDRELRRAVDRVVGAAAFARKAGNIQDGTPAR